MMDFIAYDGLINSNEPIGPLNLMWGTWWERKDG